MLRASRPLLRGGGLRAFAARRPQATPLGLRALSAATSGGDSDTTAMPHQVRSYRTKNDPGPPPSCCSAAPRAGNARWAFEGPATPRDAARSHGLKRPRARARRLAVATPLVRSAHLHAPNAPCPTCPPRPPPPRRPAPAPKTAPPHSLTGTGTRTGHLDPPGTRTPPSTSPLGRWAWTRQSLTPQTWSQTTMT